MRQQTTVERGRFKKEISTALYNSESIKRLLLGDISNMSAKEVRQEFKKHVMSHLFIDDTIDETDSFVFYDVRFPYLNANIKSCQVVMYVVCHRDILDNYECDEYDGNRADVLSQMVEDCLINDEKTAYSFGIGRLALDSVEVYNSRKLYGCLMIFSVPGYR